MIRSHWVLVAFVATFVCNASCRPREVDVKNIYPVYRSEKQLGLENRYEKKSTDEDSVSYHRIDIPYGNQLGGLAVKNNSKSVIDYVPVALTVKRPNLKKWPSGQNGIESADDLSLYHIYTNNINPMSIHHATTPGHKPSILILEELTTRRPVYDLDSVYTQPIQVLDRPHPIQVDAYYPPRPPIQHPTFPPPPIYNPTLLPTPPPPMYNPTLPPTPPSPIYNPTLPPTPPPPMYNPTLPPTPPPPPIYNPTLPPAPPPTTLSYYTTSQEPMIQTQPPLVQTVTVTVTYPNVQPPTSLVPVEATTKKKKNTRCPNVSITASTNVNNNNEIHKEGCQDIEIHINTEVSNSNSGVVRPGTSSNGSPVVVVQNEGTRPGVLDAIWALVTRIFNFSYIFNPIYSGALSPFSTFFTGLSAFFIPWIFPHLLLQSVRKQKRSVGEGGLGWKNRRKIFRHKDGGVSRFSTGIRRVT